ncbi:hypothetical protein Egran_00263 [Elaphomyces granulatus]|uniref:Uncharacterized protein n=1 Tax=Elaphomyces granulatus TaxID=519963 RepID=A0A232M6F9_9EURO|nr:hypothetical protein Egran_00263 [Elaphomyces granulatus]
MAEEKTCLPPIPSPSDGCAYREALQAHISALEDGLRRDAFMAVLKRAGEKPSKTPLQARIEEIKFLLEGELIGEHREDVTAVLEGYESGSLEYIP